MLCYVIYIYFLVDVGDQATQLFNIIIIKIKNFSHLSFKLKYDFPHQRPCVFVTRLKMLVLVLCFVIKHRDVLFIIWSCNVCVCVCV